MAPSIQTLAAFRDSRNAMNDKLVEDYEAAPDKNTHVELYI
jgi:hypothetical protein